ncbi:MAG: hypothetical protein AAFQ89_12615 [Cyanobacteria bacterium J06626_18]
MSRRSRKHKKHFACGHRGFGQYCHCCADRFARKQVQQAYRKRQRDSRQAAFAEDEIDLRGLPKQIVLKARKVLAELSAGNPYWEMAGKRLHMAREVVRIPVTRRYRLLCHHDGKAVKPLVVMSHEEYNSLFRSPKRLLSKLFS